MENHYEKQFLVTDDLLASNQQRFANYLIDYAVQVVFGLVLGIGLGIVLTFFGYSNASDFFEKMTKVQEYIFGIVIALLYYNLTEIFMARSIAKFITRTLVVMEDGSKPDYRTILMRTICRIIPFNQLSFLGTPCRGWHDSLSKTYVVKKNLFEEKRDLFYSFEEIGKTGE
ncbi:RDD family protein [Flavobacterium sp. XGLA_31]|uniref:RDD family protein n=1 Tax=Flavobacterium sp. XGLA_31 TaxID=3447666 RepID=UPI003F40F7BD